MTLYDMVEEQMKAEIGEEAWEDRTLIPHETLMMLAQKWGLKIPKLIQSEMYLIHREEQRARDARVRREWR